MLSKKKKIIVLSTMLVLLVATGWLNIMLNNSADPVLGEEMNSDFFSTYRTDRTATRNQTMLYLDGIINSAASTDEVIAQAQAQKLELARLNEVEPILESLIKAREGFDDCIVTMSTENINVIVRCAEMTEEQMSQILGLIRAETGVSARYIRIVPVE